MPMKRQWKIKLGSVGRRLTHLYNGNACTGMRYEVYLNGVVADGPEKGRDVVLDLSPDDADALAVKLTEWAAITRKANKEAGQS